MNEDRQSSDHLVLGGLLFLVFSLVVALVFVYTRADDTTGSGIASTTATINNTAPTVDTVNVAYADNVAHIASTTGLTLALGTTQTVVVWGDLTDDNGNGDFADVSAVFYRSGATNGTACTADMNECYRGATSTSVSGALGACTIATTTDTGAHYACTFALQYFTDGTKADGGEFPAEDWQAFVTVTDLSAATGTGTAVSEVNALTALNIPLTIPYGTFGLGATTTASNNQDMTLTQKGNTRADVTVAGTAMTCSGLGTIAVGQQKWATSTDVGYTDASAVVLTGSGVDTDLDVDYQKDESFASASSTRNIYWNIGIPTSGVRGLCSGTNTITVLLH